MFSEETSIGFWRFLNTGGPPSSCFDLWFLYFLYLRKTGSAGGAFAAYTDDILAYGEPDALPKIRDFSEQRSGELKLLEPSRVHVGMEVVQASGFSVTPKQGEFMRAWKPPPTSPQLWAVRQKTLAIEDVKLRQR